MRALKFAGVVICSLALSATTAVAAPEVLDDDALDGVVAGFGFPGSSSTQVNLLPVQIISGGSLFERPESTLPVATVVPLESDVDSGGNTLSGPTINGGGLGSTASTSGGPAAAAGADPTSVYPGTQTPIFRFPYVPSRVFP